MIATNVGGINEIFGPTEGSLLPSGDSAALRTAMQRFLDKPETAEQEVRVRLGYMATRFSLRRMVDQIEVNDSTRFGPDSTE